MSSNTSDKLEEQMDPNAAYNLGIKYFEGKTIQKDHLKAIELWEKASNSGHAPSSYALGNLYMDGISVQQDTEQAIKLWQKASVNGLAAATFNVATAYYKEKKLDSQTIIKLYGKAAEQGSVNALFEIGKFYLNGWGVKVDIREAASWFKKAASQKHTEASKALYSMCLKYDFLDEDNSIKLFCCQNLAEQGVPEYQHNLGVMYSTNSITQDKSKALYWYEKAAMQGFLASQENAAAYYQNGIGVEKNDTHALHWYIRAADNGSANAQYFAGQLLAKKANTLEKEEATIHYNKAVEYYQKAVDQNDARACINLASLYLVGQGVEENKSKAFDLYSAAELYGKDTHRAIAQFNLYLMYKQGDGVKKNEKKALEMLIKSAENKNPDAQFTLWIFYTQKDDTKSKELAEEWLKKAFEQGNINATKVVNGLSNISDFL